MNPRKDNSAPDDATRARWRSYPPYYRHLGGVLEELGDGTCIVRLAPRPELGNSKGDIHGGAIASLLDIVQSQAVRSRYDAAVNVATITMNLSYLATAAGEITGHGKVIRAGTTIAYAEGEIRSADGAILAKASATYRIIRPRQR